jgi:hypothetical protein
VTQTKRVRVPPITPSLENARRVYISMEDEVWVRLPATGRKLGCGVTDAREKIDSSSLVSIVLCPKSRVSRMKGSIRQVLGTGWPPKPTVRGSIPL